MEIPKYFVIQPDGSRYGPADVETLNRWVQEGRINFNVVVAEEQSQRQMSLREVPGIGPGAYATYARYGYQGKDDRSWANASIIVGAIGTLTCLCTYAAIPLSIAGIVCGGIGKSKKQPGSLGGIILSSVALVIAVGMFIAAAGATNYLRGFGTPHR